MAETIETTAQCHPSKPNPLLGSRTAGANIKMESAHSDTCTANSIITTTGASHHHFPATKTTEATRNNDGISINYPTKTKWPPWPRTPTKPPSADLQATHTLPPLPQSPPPSYTPTTDRRQEIPTQAPRPPPQPPPLIRPALPDQCLKTQSTQETGEHLPTKRIRTSSAPAQPAQIQG